MDFKIFVGLRQVVLLQAIVVQDALDLPQIAQDDTGPQTRHGGGMIRIVDRHHICIIRKPSLQIDHMGEEGRERSGIHDLGIGLGNAGEHN